MLPSEMPLSTTPSGTQSPQADFIPDTAPWINSYTALWRTKPGITDWSLELLQSLEWKRYEMLCAEYFRILGKRVETIAKGADGGIDARIYAKNSDVLEYAIQCKSWSRMIGVKEIRELFCVMAHESAGKGIFMSTSLFSNDAKEFAAEHKDKLFLIDAELFLSMLSNLPDAKRKVLLDFATEGDYLTPTCASCGIKMVRRPGKAGEFWGCMNYSRGCRSTFKIARLSL
jgi:restriction system protein